MLYHQPRIKNTAHTHTKAHAQTNSSDKNKSAHFIPMAKIDTSSSLRLMDLTHTVIWLMPQFWYQYHFRFGLALSKTGSTIRLTLSLCKRIQTNEIRHSHHKNNTRILVVLWQWTALKLSEYDDGDDLIRLNNKG